MKLITNVLEDNLFFTLNEENRRWVITDKEALELLKKGELTEEEKKRFYPFFEPTNFQEKSDRLLIVYHLTNSCNYACKYCYASAGEGKGIPLDKAFRFIDNLKENNWGFNKFTIEFHGGEPLLEFEKIKKIVEYGKKSGLDIKWDMQSNGSLITDEICEFLKENNVNIGVSIDGPAIIHDYQRVYKNEKGTFEDTLKGIKKLQQYKIRFGIISVATKRTLEYKDKYFNFLVKNGITGFALNPMYPFGRGSSLKDEVLTSEELYELYLYLLDRTIKHNRKNQQKINFNNIRILLSSITIPSYYYRCANSPCGAGRDMLGLSPEGKVYPCEEFVGDKRFIIGDINSKPNKIFRNKIVNRLKIESSFEKSGDCNSCPFKFICGGGCKAKRYYCSGGFSRKDIFCEFNKRIIRYLILKVYKEKWRRETLWGKIKR